jgi:hypothetical protein
LLDNSYNIGFNAIGDASFNANVYIGNNLTISGNINSQYLTNNYYTKLQANTLASNTAAILRPATVRVLSWRKRGDLRRVGVGEAANTGADEVAVAVSTLSTPTSECTIFASG